MNNPGLVNSVAAHSPTGQLRDMPIDSVLITAGNPVARGAVLTQSAEKTLSSGVWSCEPGEFDWEHTWDEFIYVLEGELIVTEEGGNQYTLGPTDMAYFPRGLKSHWHVTKAMRKFFVLKTSEPFEV